MAPAACTRWGSRTPARGPGQGARRSHVPLTVYAASNPHTGHCVADTPSVARSPARHALQNECMHGRICSRARIRAREPAARGLTGTPASTGVRKCAPAGARTSVLRAHAGRWRGRRGTQSSISAAGDLRLRMLLRANSALAEFQRQRLRRLRSHIAGSDVKRSVENADATQRTPLLAPSSLRPRQSSCTNSLFAGFLVEAMSVNLAAVLVPCFTASSAWRSRSPGPLPRRAPAGRRTALRAQRGPAAAPRCFCSSFRLPASRLRAQDALPCGALTPGRAGCRCAHAFGVRPRFAAASAPRPRADLAPPRAGARALAMKKGRGGPVRRQSLRAHALQCPVVLQLCAARTLAAGCRGST